MVATAMATRKRAKGEPEEQGPQPADMAWGEYRCYHRNSFERPCNKLLGYGAGPFEGVCPRCGRKSTFARARDPLAR